MRVVASKLEGPSGLQAGSRRLFVAETGDGKITRVNPGTGRKRLVRAGAEEPGGVARVGLGWPS